MDERKDNEEGAKSKAQELMCSEHASMRGERVVCF
jgi:hypothetical protein